MKIIIEIDCDTISEAYAHLTVLQKQIKKQTKINKVDPDKDDFPAGTEFYDDNCYSTHTASVYEE